MGVEAVVSKTALEGIERERSEERSATQIGIDTVGPIRADPGRLGA